ncbi:MAG: hypothetical protein JKY22_04160 [Flavobacteriaceae bacterium]|nr:hypothetical protein [Flavobacteriaceae bacterium]
MKKHFTFLVVTVLLSASSLLAQSTNNHLISIDDNFVISLNQTGDTAIAQQYELDISSLDFKSAKELEQFCQNSAGKLHQFKGDFVNKTITIALNTSEVNRRGIKAAGINKYFLSTSRDLRSAYDNLKNN